MNMDIQINSQPFSLPDGARLSDALALYGAVPPYAVAINGEFVPRAQYWLRVLVAGDRIDVVKPVAGG